MTKEDCFFLGHVAKLQGYKGEISIHLDVDNPEKYKNLESVFVEINNLLTPFFVSKIELRQKNFAHVKFDGVDTDEKARKLLGKELFLPAVLLEASEEDEFYIHELTDYLVIDETFGVVGKIIQIIEMELNPLMEISNERGEVLIPLQKEIIKKIDKEKMELHITTPEGLIEINFKQL
jgi:16S rRNA processing protein RimM